MKEPNRYGLKNLPHLVTTVVIFIIACIIGVCIGATIDMPFLGGLFGGAYLGDRGAMDAALESYRIREAEYLGAIDDYRTAIADGEREAAEYRDELRDIRSTLAGTREDARAGVGAVEAASGAVGSATGAVERQGGYIRELEEELRRLLGGSETDDSPADAGSGD